MEPIVHHGNFWLASNPDEQVAGVLTFDRTSGANLTLIGSLSGAQRLDGATSNIHGHTDGGEVTLLRCFRTSWRSGTLVHQDVWKPQMMLAGACLADDDLLFDNVYFEIDGFLEWASPNGIRQSHSRDDTGVVTGIGLDVDEVPTTSIELPDSGTLLVQFPANNSGDLIRSETLTRTARLHRTWHTAQPLAVITNEIRAFEHLMTIAIHEGCSHRTITLQHPAVVTAVGTGTYREPIELRRPSAKR